MRRFLIFLVILVIATAAGLYFFWPPFSQSITKYELPIASLVSPPPVQVEGYAVALAQASQAPVPNVTAGFASVGTVQVEDSSGTWYSIPGATSTVPLLGYSKNATSTVLGQGPLPAGDYQAVRYTLGAATLVTSKNTAVTVPAPATTFTVPILLIVDSGDVSSVKLNVITKQSITGSSSQSFAFVPNTEVETHTRAEILVSSDDQSYIYLNDGVLTQVVSASMNSLGTVNATNVPITTADAFVKPLLMPVAAPAKTSAPTASKYKPITQPASNENNPPSQMVAPVTPVSTTPTSPVPTSSAPTFTYLGSQSVVVGSPLSFSVHATSPQELPLMYTAVILPAGSSFNPNTQTFSWTPGTPGTYTTLFSVSDGTHTIEQTIPIIVLTNSQTTQPVTPATATPQPPLTPSPSNSLGSGSGLQVNFGQSGITNILYNGTEVAGNYYGGNTSVESTFIRSDGTSYEGNNVISNTAWNANTDTRTDSYPWGSIAAHYTVQSNRLVIQYTVSNTSGDTMQGFNIQGPDIETAGNDQDHSVAVLGALQPTVAVMNFGFGTLAIADDDPSEDAYVAIISTPSITDHVLRFGTEGENWASPSDWPPVNDMPIGPGKNATYEVSLRFAPQGTSAISIAPDVYQSFAQRFPSTLNWPDRRPIARVFPADASPANLSATNPHGWLDDPSIDVTNPAGLADFQNRMIAFATATLANLQQYGAQGMVAWDIEGDNWPFLYVGDPTMATTLSPELAYQNTVGAFFKVFTDAGMKVGVTLRDQDVVIGNDGTPSVVTPPDEAQDYIRKINYAKSNWGATLFYIDSIDADTSGPVLKEVQAAEPGVLLMPEHSDFLSYAYSASYTGLINVATIGTPPDIASTYPSTFSVIDIDNDTANSNNYQATVSAVRNGDALMFNGNPGSASADELTYMTNAYRDAGKPLSISASPVSKSPLFAAASESGAENGTLASAIILAVIALSVLTIIFVSPP